MSAPEDPSDTLRTRREPPRYRRVELHCAARLGPHMVRVTLGGRELEGLRVDEPAASVRLLLPSSGSTDLEMPAWNGNEFLLADGSRPTIRTFTPGRLDPRTNELDLDVVIHPDGAASSWATSAEPGAPAAVSGPGRGYEVDPDASTFLVAGDESAIPAIRQLLEVLPPAAPVQVHVEVRHPDARLPLPDRPEAIVSWHDLPPGAPPGQALFDAVASAEVLPDAHVWAAGEAAAMQRIRRHLFDDRGLSRAQAHVRGYWKRGRSEGA